MSSKTLIRKYGTKFTLHRYAPSTNTFGTVTPGAEIVPEGGPLVIVGSMQPLGFADTMLLAEGQRQRDAQRFYTLTELHATSQEEGSMRDVLEAPNGQLWEVFKEATFKGIAEQNQPLPHYKYIVQRTIQDQEA